MLNVNRCQIRKKGGVCGEREERDGLVETPVTRERGTHWDIVRYSEMKTWAQNEMNRKAASKYLAD